VLGLSAAQRTAARGPIGALSTDAGRNSAGPLRASVPPGYSTALRRSRVPQTDSAAA